MKVLSVQQPWASLIAAGIKDVENRTWKPKEIPERILIHASKKCSVRTISNEPIEWIQEMFDEQTMGNLPDFPDMPSNAIIGYFSIDRIDQKVDGSIWASGDDDMDGLYYWHVKDCYLFDEPILDVKGKLHLWEYDMDENNMPPAHKVPLVCYKEIDDDIFMPVEEKRWNELGENQELNFELGVLASNDLCKEGTYDLKPYKSIIIGYNGQTRKFRLTEETEARVFITENGEPEKYNSLFSPDGAERWVARFVWAEEIK